MRIILFLQIITFIINSSFGIFVFQKKPKSYINILYCIFSVALGLWSLSLFFVISKIGPQLLLSKLAFTFGLIMTSSLFYFSLVFPKNKLPSKIINILVGIPTFIILCLTLTDKIVKNVTTIGDHITGEFGVAMPLFTLLTLGLSLANTIILIYKYYKAEDVTKKQIAYVLFGFLFFQITFQTTNLILPIFFDIYGLNSLGPIFAIPMVIIISIAVIKHRLMEIKIIIQKSLIYTSLVVVIIAIYLFFISILGYLLQRNTNTTILVSAILTTIIGIFTVPKIKNIFCKITDKIFFKDKYDYSEALHKLSQILNKNLELNTLLKETIINLEEILKVKDIKIMLQNHVLFTKDGIKEHGEKSIEGLHKTIKQKNISVILKQDISVLTEEAKYDKNLQFIIERAKHISEKYNTELFALTFLNEELIAVLLLSEKLSGDQYSNEDISLINTFTNQMAVALGKARLYKEVKNHSLELEKKVDERTSEIKKLQKEQEQMILDISHGLQTPLTIIRGELEFLQAKTNNKKLKDFEKSIDNISKFIYDLLTLSKLESKDHKFRKELLDFSELVEGLVEYFPTLVQDKNIEIKNNIAKNIVIWGNKNKLEELINNLVSNSIKYIGEGTYIKVSLYENIKYIILEIEDDGIGISTKDLKHIFNRFYRANTQTKGSGLGLSICKKIADKHHGTVEASSEIDKGTKFTIKFKKPSK